jgi:hypothetical protein
VIERLERLKVLTMQGMGKRLKYVCCYVRSHLRTPSVWFLAELYCMPLLVVPLLLAMAILANMKHVLEAH